MQNNNTSVEEFHKKQRLINIVRKSRGTEPPKQAQGIFLIYNTESPYDYIDLLTKL